MEADVEYSEDPQALRIVICSFRPAGSLALSTAERYRPNPKDLKKYLIPSTGCCCPQKKNKSQKKINFWRHALHKNGFHKKNRKNKIIFAPCPPFLQECRMRGRDAVCVPLQGGGKIEVRNFSQFSAISQFFAIFRNFSQISAIFRNFSAIFHTSRFSDCLPTLVQNNENFFFFTIPYTLKCCTVTRTWHSSVGSSAAL